MPAGVAERQESVYLAQPVMTRRGQEAVVAAVAASLALSAGQMAEILQTLQENQRWSGLDGLPFLVVTAAADASAAVVAAEAWESAVIANEEIGVYRLARSAGV